MTAETVAHDPLVKGRNYDDCWVICRGCGYEGSDQPESYTPGVLKISTSRNNASRIAREHRRAYTTSFIPSNQEEH